MTISQHEGRDVIASQVRVTGAGDGLSAAMSIAAGEFHLGDSVFLVLETECVRVAHEEIKDTDDLRRVHTLKATDGTVVDHEAVAAILDSHRIAVEKAQGIERLPMDEDDSDDA